MSSPVVTSAGSHVVELGGQLVHLTVVPGEEPPILLLGGCAVPSFAYRSVIAGLPGRWLVALDRAGLVDTPWPGRLPTLAAEVATLAELCAAFPAPPVVVAHSMAGPHAEALVRTHPGAVRGLVLLDASVEVHATPPSDAYNRAWLAASRATLAGTQHLPSFGAGASFATRLMVWGQSRRLRLTYARPPRARETFQRPDTLAAVVAEQAAYAQQLADLQELIEATAWPGTPTIVLTAGSRSRWVRKQRVLADRMSARQVVVEDSRHLMMVDRPDVVVDAILALTQRPGRSDAERGRAAPAD